MLVKVTDVMKRSLNQQFNKLGVQITDVAITNVCCSLQQCSVVYFCFRFAYFFNVSALQNMSSYFCGLLFLVGAPSSAVCGANARKNYCIVENSGAEDEATG